MPGYDGTGPLGQGPLTGGGRGPCNGNSEPLVGRGRGLGPCGAGYARGARRGRGLGMGRGMGRAFAAPVAQNARTTDAATQRIAALEEQVRELKELLLRSTPQNGEDA